jgi:hypothetical protein
VFAGVIGVSGPCENGKPGPERRLVTEASVARGGVGREVAGY